MQYLTKNFYSKYHVTVVNGSPKIDTKGCIKKLNKWLAKPDQQDVKVDDFDFKQEWGVESQYRTRLTIIYHHVKFNYPPNV